MKTIHNIIKKCNVFDQHIIDELPIFSQDIKSIKKLVMYEILPATASVAVTQFMTIFEAVTT